MALDFEKLLIDGFEIYPFENKFRVYTKETFFFFVKSIDELTDERIEEEKKKYQNKLSVLFDWTVDYWERIKTMKLPPYETYFTADLHLGHRNVLDFSHRNFSDVEEMDHSIIEEWNETINKKDVVYIVGDFLWKNKQYARRVLEKLNGTKHFIRGNHDKAINGNENYFESVSDIKNVEFKRDLYPFIEEDRFIVTMCHYPMTSFYQKPRYSMQLHGHVHGNMDIYNARSSDLRVDVGYDSKTITSSGFTDLQSLYAYYYTKRELTKDFMINR